ncbi:DUF6155 family protein [Zeaxanthinibacter sp. PT1]|uniref:DUF6155 family protein n=1 Tax=Zeaxanthinibacter TaxID=561554 RepID=UPI00234B12F5|nr:DUF6155 family protein [Zeaxanthinibacter sp. PT1]MDC6351532.1 DUF6155 family protein [Zeaxanthinibacter sp. PT1]
MSKRALKKYVAELPKEELELQLIALYERYPEVKKYYDFIFNPKEEALVQEAKAKISYEYFPTRRKRARARRSVAHKYIKSFRKLEMDPQWVAELMLYNLEIAQVFEEKKPLSDAFYKSMWKSYSEAIQFISYHHLKAEFEERIRKILNTVQEREWPYESEFIRVYELLEEDQQQH